jgi:hypothetical protein
MWTLPLRVYVFFSCMSRFKRAYVGFVCLFVVGMIASGQAQLFWRLWRIGAAPAETTGEVVGVDCPNHGHIFYSLKVDGSTYDGRNGFVDGINCPDVKIGQRVGIYYEAGAPANNYALYPPEAAGNPPTRIFVTRLLAFSSFILLGPLFLAWLWTVVARWTRAG